MSQQAAAARALSTRVLLLLLLAYIFNFLDRQIVSILKIPIKAELGLSDTQLGLMGGIAFASVYSTLAIPIARYADRTGRRARVIGIAAAVWSLFTALCGFVTSFWQLFAARMGVGVGEAGGVAPSYALIAQHFPPGRRARALAVFSLGIPIGSALGLFFGGWLAETINWRTAFIIIGLAGLPVGWLIATQVPEAPAGAPAAALADDTPRFLEVAGELARKPSFWLLSFGAASCSIGGYGLGFWLPSYFSESLGLSLGSIGSFFGTIVLIGGSAGILLGGALADKLGGSRPAAYALTPAVAFLFTAPLYALAMSVEARMAAWMLFTLAYALSLAWLGPIISAVQGLVDAPRRATASASFLLINNLIGIGFGTFIFGYLADLLRPAYGSEAMRYSILYGLGFYLLAALLCLLAAWRLGRDTKPQAV
ncbi:MAG: MFS transporter [Pseudomonadota bacterium]|nr:MFS transporter [Sphingomonas sp.]MDQ3477968.1 MFS transporter [Pseudomonadota bacterium]